MSYSLTEDMKGRMRIPYAMRHVPRTSICGLRPLAQHPQTGDIALASVESIGKNTRLELVNGRAATLHEGDLLGLVFGNRYASQQFEGYARADGDRCDLMSMGGLCGLVTSRHAGVAEPSRMRLLGALAGADGQPLRLRDFALPPASAPERPTVIVVCGTAMDAGKTYTAMSIVRGLSRHGERVAGIKLTGTAAGRDTWSMADAGAAPALNFIDGGYPSTYLCSLQQLLELFDLLVAHAGAAGAAWAVVEIADGVLQAETAALLKCPAFTSRVDAWMFATGDPLAAAGGIRVLRNWQIRPLAISGLISMSPLAMQEATEATGVECWTAAQLQSGELNHRFGASATPGPEAAPRVIGMVQARSA